MACDSSEDVGDVHIRQSSLDALGFRISPPWPSTDSRDHGAGIVGGASSHQSTRETRTAHRTKQRVGQILRYAIATGRAERDVSADLRGALVPSVTKNHAAITDPLAIGQLLRAIDGYRGQAATHAALKLAPLVFVRPGEMRHAEWSEINLDAAEWRIPAPRMKIRELHIVPLATQALEILRSMLPITGRSRFVFPSLRTNDRPLSENTINAALRRLGYATDEMTGHGFRAMASTSLNEQGWHPDLIELQFAHAERNKVRAAYNRATRLAERRAMMQAWAGHLDMLRIETAPDHHQYRKSANQPACQDGILDNRPQRALQA